MFWRPALKISPKMRIGAVLVGLMALPLTPTFKYVAWSGYFAVRERASRIAFDSAAWKNLKPERSVSRTKYRAFPLPPRLRMVDDLVDHQVLHGRTRPEVLELVGEQDPTEYFSDWDLVYWLGPGRYGDAVGDSEWLVVRFGDDGRVSQYRVVHD